ncbi:peptide deformylase [Kamptonema cortianum]|nr:peptide deformylase [Geitlerinema splendidum]MDK3162146.1 peptide deformylase [Kamptonema cortianum]
MDVVVPAEFQHLYVRDDSRPVYKIPDPVLRTKAEPITKVSKRHKVLADNMVRIMKQANGVGLAGPQIGVSERIIVIAPDKKPIVLLNPEITKATGSQVGEEGCLSIPGLYGDVERFEEVEVEAFDIKGRPIGYQLRGYGAVIVQHEIDHLDGVLFIDKVNPATLHWQDPNPKGE